MAGNLLQDESDGLSREPLAVIGIGCRLPGGIDSPPTFWKAIWNGIDAIRDVPPDRWTHSHFHDTNPDKAGCIRNAKGGFIDGVDQFDAEFFGYFPAEAQRLDPQQRLLLEVTHEAMEDAGIRRDQLDGSATSVFIGSFMYDYLCIQAAAEQRDEINPYVAMGTSVSSLANRISYDFNLKGPSISLDTACSSSLVAVHLACRSLWGKEAAMAIAGGVNVMLRPESSILLSKAGFLTTDQYCKAFDAAANGYVRSEGAGVVIIKPLSRALADGDAIYAIIRGSAVNQDGYLPEGFTVPNVYAQIDLLRAAYADAAIDPSSVRFVEAHGTGTPVGDPIECMAIGTVLGQNRAPEQPCLLGSVKTNLGHLEGAAGIAGFIKGVLAAHRGAVPANLHFHQPNPVIDFDDLKLKVPTRSTRLERDGQTVTVGVNSFGAGGTNAHIVLQELVDITPTNSLLTTRHSPLPYVLSAANRDALRLLALKHAEFLDTMDVRLEDAAYSAFARRSHYPHVLAVVGENAHAVSQRLRAFADGKIDSETLTTKNTRKLRPKLGFVFSGQGGQWLGMGRQLMERELVFRKAVEEIDDLFFEIAGWSLLDEIRKEYEESRIDDTIVVQPALMAIQIALLKLYEHYGVRPQGVVGHSIGEVAAAYAAGALSLKDAVKVIYHRSQAQNRASGKGGMLAVGLSLDEARKVIHPFGSRVSIGAVNGPQMLTLSGDTEPLQQIAQLLEARGVFSRPVRVQVAYHSHHMDPLRADMVQGINGAKPRAATTPLYSTVTGRRESGEHLTGEYWHDNARRPVLFTDALTSMLKDGFDTFVEIGPHPVLVGGAEALIQLLKSDAIIGPSMTRREPESIVFLQSLARLAARGIEVNFEALFGSERRYVRLPTHPWQHTRCWYESPAQAELRLGRFDHPFLKRRTQLVTEDGPAVWEASIGIHKFTYLRDHQVDGECVLPATAHLELAWAAACAQFGQTSFFLENVHFDSPLILADNVHKSPLEIRLEIVSNEGDYRICSRPIDGARDLLWSRHSSGRINTTHDRFEKSAISLAELQSEFGKAHLLSVEEFYQMRHAVGLDYGPKFRGIYELWRHNHQMLARLEMPSGIAEEARRYTFHPAIFDACLHVVFADVHCHGDPERAFLPYRVDRIRLHGRPTSNVWSHVRVTRNDEQFLTSDMFIFDDAGELIAEVIGLTCKRLVGGGSRQIDSSYDGCYEYRWTPSPRIAADRAADFTRAVLITGEVSTAGQGGGVALVNDLATRLASEGIQPLIVRTDDPAMMLDDALADVPLDRRTRIVFAAGVDETNSSTWTGLADCPSVALLLRLAQSLQKREAISRLYLVTNGAAGVPGDESLDLGQAILHGMARVINNECVTMPVTTIDLSRVVSVGDVNALIEEMLHVRVDRDESEIALRGESRLVRQLAPIDRETAEQSAASEEPGMGGAYRADLNEPGELDQLVFRRHPSSALSDDDVEIAVQATALNFKDIMNAMGLLPENAVAGGLTANRLGLEVAGRVLRVGAKVRNVKTGDEVIARVAEGFTGRVVTPAHFVVRRPRRLTPAQAAGIPVVYVTAWYSLCHLGRMTRGETVLIHSAAGGVGGAAIQLAQRVGATIIATAGTKEKRAWLHQQGVEHVFDSRSLECFNQIMEVTGNRGVDVVLNSLTGRFITQSLKCLAPFGRFIEIGKADIYRNSKLGLERLGENISYFVVDVDRLAAQKPQLHQQMLSDVAAMFEHGELQPLEVTQFPISKLPEALKFMTRAAYHGKIVVNMENDRVTALPPRTMSFRADRSYLITGGAGGFGLEIARWMTERGARHFALLSRNGCKNAADRVAVDAMISAGTRVVHVLADVADARAVQSAIERIQAELPPLAGVIHAAAVMDDASLANMDVTRFERVFNPKAQGAWNLHEATINAGVELDYFVMLSSISSVLGFYGQANYASANYFLDALAQFRRQRGLPATAINLGVLGQFAGLSRAADKENVLSLLESHGLLVMSLPDILAKFEAALIQQPVQRITGRFDWAKYRAAYPHLGRDTRFIDLLSDTALERGNRPKSSSLRASLAALAPAPRKDRLQQELAGALARVLDVAPEQLATTVPIDTLGLDSLMLTQLRNWILRSLDINLPLIKLLKGPSIDALAEDLLAQIETGSAAGCVQAKETMNGSATLQVADLEGIEVVNPWLIRGRTKASAPCRVICFHSMGVGASLFTNYLLHPPKDCDILAVQTPGRENRLADAVAESVDVLADQIVPKIAPFFDRPVIVWGHSYGGVIAAEVVRRLREDHGAEPAHFVVTGTMAPHLIHRWQKREGILKAMEADNSAEYLISLSRYVDDPEFIKAILPLMRRDWPLLKNYRYRSMPALGCPITAFAARQDDVVYPDEVQEWSRLTHCQFELIPVDGDHWFLNRNRELIRDKLSEIAASTRTPGILTSETMGGGINMDM